MHNLENRFAYLKLFEHYEFLFFFNSVLWCPYFLIKVVQLSTYFHSNRKLKKSFNVDDTFWLHLFYRDIHKALEEPGWTETGVLVRLSESQRRGQTRSKSRRDTEVICLLVCWVFFAGGLVVCFCFVFSGGYFEMGVSSHPWFLTPVRNTPP